jgi:hypothetical protein
MAGKCGKIPQRAYRSNSPPFLALFGPSIRINSNCRPFNQSAPSRYHTVVIRSPSGNASSTGAVGDVRYE